MAAFGEPVVPDVNCRFTMSCSERDDWILERSTALRGILSNRMKLESSGGISPLLLIMMRCANDGITEDGSDNDIPGTRCCINGTLDQEFNLGVVRNFLVPPVRPPISC